MCRHAQYGARLGHAEAKRSPALGVVIAGQRIHRIAVPDEDDWHAHSALGLLVQWPLYLSMCPTGTSTAIVTRSFPWPRIPPPAGFPGKSQRHDLIWVSAALSRPAYHIGPAAADVAAPGGGIGCVPLSLSQCASPLWRVVPPRYGRPECCAWRCR